MPCCPTPAVEGSVASFSDSFSFPLASCVALLCLFLMYCPTSLLCLATIAKDRLSVMLVHQRNNDVIQNIDMDALQAEVAGVIAKYVNIARHANANVNLKQEGDLDVLEMHFPLDQNSLGTAGGQKKMAVGKYANN